MIYLTLNIMSGGVARVQPDFFDMTSEDEEYTDGALSRVLFPGGYNSNVVAYNYVTDWQGNVRQVIDGSTGEPVQETHLV